MTRLGASLDAWAGHHLRRPERNPLALALFLLTALYVLPGLHADFLQQAATVMLLLGCLGSTVGIIWPRRDTGLSLELSGALLTGVACVVYAVVSAQPGAALTVSAACFTRSVQIGLYVRGRQLTYGGEPKGLP